MKKTIILGLVLALVLLLLSLFLPKDTAYRIFFALAIPLWMGFSIHSTVKSAREASKKDHNDRIQFILDLLAPLLLIFVLGFGLFQLHVIDHQKNLSPDIQAGLLGGALFLALIFRAVRDVRERRLLRRHQEDLGEDQADPREN